MVLRQELINSAVSFLQDPRVANAPLNKRIAFLESKKLTPDEITASLQQTEQIAEANRTPVYAPPTRQAVGGYVPPYYGNWQQPPPQSPPELPRRDWRDYFILATLTSSVTLGLYLTCKRYLLPLIAPPTPDQITQDKAAIDASFTRAFNSLERLETDTCALKDAETARSERLDNALAELENVLASLKESERKREDEARRRDDEVRGMNELIPKALECQKTATEARIFELSAELKSLGRLMSGRLSGNSPMPPGLRPESPPSPAASTSAAASTSTASAVKAPTPRGSPFPLLNSEKVAIPAWQMLASKKADDKELRNDELSKTESVVTSA